MGQTSSACALSNTLNSTPLIFHRKSVTFLFLLSVVKKLRTDITTGVNHFHFIIFNILKLLQTKGRSDHVKQSIARRIQ